jgi:hypothetical protein
MMKLLPTRSKMIMTMTIKNTNNNNSNNNNKNKNKNKNKAKKSSKASSSSSSSMGFGSSSSSKSNLKTLQLQKSPKTITNPLDDTFLLPPLDDRILQTLLPVMGDPYDHDPTDLPMDIYERLEYLYGFPNFNYPSNHDNNNNDDYNNHLQLSHLPPWTQFHILHIDPLVLSIPNFFTRDECEHYISLSQNNHDNNNNNSTMDPTLRPYQTRSKTVGKDSMSQAQRTSTTWFHPYKAVPELMAKASRLLGLDTIHCFEEPQTVRYRRSERFTWHLDALDTSTTVTTTTTQKNSGQRIATLLVYLTTLTPEEGGATLFRDLKLRVQPQQGSALLFFPAAGGLTQSSSSSSSLSSSAPTTTTIPIDFRTLHCGEAVSDYSQNDKWIAQLWLRNMPYIPTAPPGNCAKDATPAIVTYAQQYDSHYGTKN